MHDKHTFNTGLATAPRLQPFLHSLCKKSAAMSQIKGALHRKVYLCLLFGVI